MPQYVTNLGKGSSSPQEVRRQGMAQQMCAMVWWIQTRTPQGPPYDGAHGIGRTAEACIWRLAVDEHSACGTPRSPPFQVIRYGFADLLKQRHPIYPVALSPNRQLSGPPINVLQLEVDHLPGTQSKPGQQNQYGEVA
jgi:hypothetical protein